MGGEGPMTNITRGTVLAILLVGGAQLAQLPVVESAAARSPGAVLGASLGDWTHVLGPRMKAPPALPPAGPPVRTAWFPSSLSPSMWGRPPSRTRWKTKRYR